MSKETFNNSSGGIEGRPWIVRPHREHQHEVAHRPWRRAGIGLQWLRHRVRQLRTDWLAFFNQGSAQGWVSWAYVSCSQVAVGPAAAGSCQLTAPTALGIYDLRLLVHDSYTVLASLHITVAPPTPTPIPPLAPSLVSSATTVAPGGTFTTTWATIPNPRPRDWVGFFVPGSVDNWVGRWLYVDCTQVGSSSAAAGSCPMTAPSTPGAYELRLLANDSYTVLASVSVTVTAPTATPTPSVPLSCTVGTTSVARGGPVTVNWANIPNPTPRDWVSFLVQGTAQGWAGHWEYMNCTQVAESSAVTTGSCQLTTPNTPGTYDLRLLANDSYTVLATLSINVT